jgi:PTS system galactitol-specific IIC component
MQFIEKVMGGLVGLGPSVMLPIVMAIIAICCGVKVGRAVRSGMLIGVGFVGIGLIVGLMTDNLGPAAHAMSDRFGLSLSVVDVGWPGAAPLSWASPIAAVAIPIAILVNLVMLFTRTTRVINLDVWNIWHFAFSGALVHLATGSYSLAVVGVVIHAVIAYKLGDWFAPVVEDYFRLEGVAMPHGTQAWLAPIAVPIDWLLDRIPVVRDINLDPEFIEKRFGVFGDPMVIGGVLGVAIGALAGYEIERMLKLGIMMGAVMVLMPRIVGCIVEGLLPISEAAKAKLQNRLAGEKFYLGLDPSIMLGDSRVVAAGLLFVPLTILIAIVMPGNEVLPFGDLPTVGFFVAMTVGIHRGNLFRTLISGTVIMSVTIWIANQTIQLNTMLAQASGSALIKHASTRIASLDQGGSPITYLLTQGFSMTNVTGFVAIGLAYLFCIACTVRLYHTKRAHKQRELALQAAGVGG